MEPSVTTTFKIVKHKSLLDLYFECGPSIHFMVLSVILFLLLAAYVGTRRSSIPLFMTLLAYSFLPIIIGLFGCVKGLQFFFHILANNRAQDPSSWQGGVIECLNPLLVGSFLSAVFLCLTPIIYLISSKRIAHRVDDARQ